MREAQRPVTSQATGLCWKQDYTQTTEVVCIERLPTAESYLAIPAGAQYLPYSCLTQHQEKQESMRDIRAFSPLTVLLGSSILTQ